MYQIIHRSNTNECLFVHPPPNQTNKTTDANRSLSDYNPVSVYDTYKKKNNEKYLSTGNSFLLQRVYTFITLFLVALNGGIEIINTNKFLSNKIKHENTLIQKQTNKKSVNIGVFW